MDYKLLMNTAMLAGKLMLENGAETYRVEDTMHHILKTSHLEVVEILVVLTGITASISGEEVAPVTLIQGIEKRGTNLSVIEQVNQISRRYCGAEIELIDAYEELKRVESVPYPPLLAFFYSIGGSSWIYHLLWRFSIRCSGNADCGTSSFQCDGWGKGHWDRWLDS